MIDFREIRIERFLVVAELVTSRTHSQPLPPGASEDTVAELHPRSSF